MSTGTGIEWTDATWNPIRGCSRVSEGCRNCYAETVANRFCGPGKPYEGVVQIGADGRGNGKWNGQIKFVEKHLLDPLRWKKPQRIFVNSMSDLFHENVTDEMLDRIFAVMALCPQHTFQVLTKRPERMLAYLDEEGIEERIRHQMVIYGRPDSWVEREWPLPNVHLGVSVENQKAADERIPLLLQTPAAKKFLSCEPLLGPVNIKLTLSCYRWILRDQDGPLPDDYEKALDWVIVGGESGAGARPMHPDWPRSLRDQCVAAGVPFFFKQWGEWEWGEPVYWSATPELAGKVYGPFRPTCVGKGGDRQMMCRAYPSVIPGRIGEDDRSFVWIWESRRAGKHAAGALLDGREWREMPR